MPSCCVCKNKSGSIRSPYARSLNYHRFPSRTEPLQKMWIQQLKINGKWYHGFSTRAKVICSDHFDESSLDRAFSKPRLREGAYPTLFGRLVRQPKKKLLCLDWPEEVFDDKVAKPKEVIAVVNYLARGKNPDAGTKVANSKVKEVQDAGLKATEVPNNQLLDGSASEKTKKTSNDNLAEKASQITVADQDVSYYPEQWSPNNVDEGRDPLWLDTGMHKHLAVDDQISNEHLATNYIPLARVVGDPDITCKKEEEVCGDYETSQSNAEKAGECPIKESDSDADDRQVYNEILTVNECMVIEDCQKIEEPSFEVAKNKDVEKVTVENQTIDITTDFRCDICLALLDSEIELNSHKRRCLLTWKPFGCIVCKKRFWDAKVVRAHRKIHWTVVCENCGFTFTKRTKKSKPCPHCKHVPDKIGLKAIGNRSQKVSNFSSKSNDHSNGKIASKKALKDINVPKRCQQSNVINSLKVKVEQKGPQEDTVDPKNDDQSSDESALIICIKPEPMQEAVVINQNSDHAYCTGLGKGPKRKRASVKLTATQKKALVKPVYVCHTCDRHFASACDFRAHTQLVLCKRKC